MSHVDDLHGGLGCSKQALDIGSITGYDVCATCSGGFGDYRIDDIADPGPTKQPPSGVCRLLGQVDDLAPAEQAAKLNLLGGSADLGQNRSWHYGQGV